MNPPAAPIDFKLLRLFDLLYTTNSVTRCADLLGQSQPTVSIGLARLRALFNDPLFVRTPEGMLPTPRADELIVTCREALDVLRRLSDAPVEFAPGTAERTFRICMTDASHVVILPRLFSQMALLAPRIRLEAVHIDDSTAEMLRLGRADLAFGFVPELEPGFYQQVLYSQDWVCLAGPDRPCASGVLSLEDYRELPHVGLAAPTGHFFSLDSLLERAGIRRRIPLQVPGFLGLGSIVARTGLIATLPRDIGEEMARAEGLRLFDCPVPIPSFDVKLHWHTRYHHDPGNAWLRRLCAEIFQRQHGAAGASGSARVRTGSPR
ncbi:LysR family transcriptional regulator [Castellaniella sp. GW247-6E4]|uniref:LysR family transcriptional regulator n=1 Tax=Castellaniella sp. GW247-6E4 TaxID=3140380 RepID=UPI0033153258